LRRLVVLSSLLILAGLVLLLPSSSLVAHLTSSTPSVSAPAGGFGVARSSSATTDTTSTVESMVGFGLIGAGLVLEVLSLFTDVGVAVPGEGAPMKEEARQP
jgi:hypothetical protein